MSKTIEHCHWPDCAGHVDAFCAGNQGARRHDGLNRRLHCGAGLSLSPAPAGGIQFHAARHGGPGARRAH